MASVTLPPKALIGMVHVGALPGTPRASQTVDELVRAAVQETWALAEGGCDAILVENMHDLPYLLREVGPEVIASMTAVCRAIQDAIDLPCGVQILAGANEEALAVALVAGMDFIRAEGFVFGHVADEGWMDACAGPLLRYRKQIGAERIAIWTDVKKKHASHAMTADVSLAETVKAAEFFGADAVVVTGAATGRETSEADLLSAHGATELPVIVGSGVTAENAATMLQHADAVIVGSALKKSGHWSGPVDLDRVKAVAAAVRAAR
ncbi:MAG: BtpA/SgcQ family protein [Chthoniobacterales bacterium]|nr:BtpA/SgcQ family protein [Chthoniobacterales bacterium]